MKKNIQININEVVLKECTFLQQMELIEEIWKELSYNEKSILHDKLYEILEHQYKEEETEDLKN